MCTEPWQNRLCIVDRPTQFVRAAVRHPGAETLTVDIQNVLAETYVTVVHHVGRPGQAGGQILPLGV